MSEANRESDGNAGFDEKKPDDGTTPAKKAKTDEANNGEKADDKKQDEKIGDKPEEDKEKKLEKKVGDQPDPEKKEGYGKEEKKDETKLEEKKEEKTEEKKPDAEKKEADEKEEKKGDRKDDAKPEEKKDEKTAERKVAQPDTEKKEGDEKEEKKVDKKDDAKPEEKKDEKTAERKVDQPDTEKKECDEKEEKKDQAKPEEKKDEKCQTPTTPTTTAPLTTATTAPSTTTTSMVTSMVGGPTVPSEPKMQPKIITSPLAGLLGRKVDPKDLHPAEAFIKIVEPRSKASSKDRKERSSSGSETISSMATLKGSTSSSGKMYPNILENRGAMPIVDEDYLKKNKDVLVLRDREIATGTYSSYYRLKLRSGKDQAIKILTLMNTTQTYKENLISQSSKIMRWLINNPHDRIVQPLDLFITTQKFYMFVPNYSFGNLESLVTPKSPPNEAAIKKLMKQIAEGMQFLVSNTIAHRAIKTTHGVFSTVDKKQVKLCGFGNAVIAKSNGAVQLQKKIMKDNFIPYMAPEVLKADYDPFIADVFSFGAMIIALLTKRYPFGPYKQSRKRTETWRQHFQRFGVRPSKELEDLIDKIVEKPQTRISLDELIKHKWFNA